MIKLEGFERDEDFLGMYGECEVYAPDGFEEYFELRRGVEGLCRLRRRLVEGLCEALLEADDPGRGLTISREHLKSDRREIKALMQVPYQYMPGVLGRTLWSTDPVGSRYVGDGFMGALRHREVDRKRGGSGELSNYAVEMRFIKSGQPNATIFDHHTLSVVPLMGAVVAPGRQKLLLRKGPSPNPHRGYLYDGLSDPDASGRQVRLSAAREGFAGGYGTGVFTAFRNTASKLETPLGLPRSFYTTRDEKGNEIKVPLRGNTGEVGTSLAPPDPDNPDSYFGDPQRGIHPTASGFGPRSVQSGGRVTRSSDRGDQPNTTGGAGTIEGAFRQFIQALGENPGMFDQRTQNYLLYRQRQQKLDPGGTYPDLEGRPSPPRRDTGLRVTNEPRPHMTKMPNVDQDGNIRKRDKRQQVPYDPERSRVEPARAVPLPERKRLRMLQYYDDVIRRYSDPNYVRQRLADARAKNPSPDPSEEEIAWERTLRDPEPFLRKMRALRDRYSQPVDSSVTFDRQNYGRGYDKVDTGVPVTGVRARRGERSRKPKTKFATKYEVRKDANGNDVRVPVKTLHPLVERRLVLPNLYSLTAAPGKPVTISRGLAEEIVALQQEGRAASEVRLVDTDGSLGDELVRKNYGKNGVTFKVGPPTAGGPDGRHFVFPGGNKVYGETKCHWALTDEHGEVMFVYRRDTREYSQPILTPGVLNAFMGNNPTGLGTISAAPAGAEESAPYESKERHLASLYGPPDESGNYRTDQDKADPRQWSGLSVPIGKAVWTGVKTYLNKMAKGDLRDRMVQREGDMVSLATIYAQNNLKNSKMLDFDQGGDVGFNMRYLKSQFRHLASAILKLDHYVKNYGAESGITTLPSQMTFGQFKEFLQHPDIQALLDHETEGTLPNGRKVRKKLIAVKMPTQYVTRAATPIERANKQTFGYKKAYARSAQYRTDERGVHLPPDTPPDAARGGYTMVNVGAAQIMQMVNEARQWYLRWIGKDMVRKVMFALELSKQSKVHRSLQGRSAGYKSKDTTKEFDLADADDVMKHAVAAQAARVSGAGYNRWRGQFESLIEQLRAAPAILSRRYGAAKADFEQRPDSLQKAVGVVTLRMEVDQRNMEYNAFVNLMKEAKLEGANPETGEPWASELEMQEWVLKNMPARVAEYEKKHAENVASNNPSDVFRTHLAAAKSHRTPREIMGTIASQVGNAVETEQHAASLGYDLIEGDPNEKQRVGSFLADLARGVYDEGDGEEENVSEQRAKEIEKVVSYHAIETLLSSSLDPRAKRQVKLMVKKFEEMAILPDFTLAAKIHFQTEGEGENV